MFNYAPLRQKNSILPDSFNINSHKVFFIEMNILCFLLRALKAFQEGGKGRNIFPDIPEIYWIPFAWKSFAPLTNELSFAFPAQIESRITFGSFIILIGNLFLREFQSYTELQTAEKKSSAEILNCVLMAVSLSYTEEWKKFEIYSLLLG